MCNKYKSTTIMFCEDVFPSSAILVFPILLGFTVHKKNNNDYLLSRVYTQNTVIPLPAMFA